MKNMHKEFSEIAWEKRELGASEEFVKKVSKKKETLIDAGLGLQMISIRLQKELIDVLKELAHDAGLGYQPYIRQILTQHIRQSRQNAPKLRKMG